MKKHRIRLRRTDFSSQRIEKHKNYGQLLDQHRRASKIRIFNYSLGLLVLGAVVGLLYYSMERLESLSVGDENNAKPHEELIQEVEPIPSPTNESPKPVMGLAAYLDYMEKHLEYPAEAWDQGIEGIVYVAFMVEPDGGISDLRVLKGLGYGCDQKALELIRQGPEWVPATRGGQTVRAPMVLPVTFKIER